MRIRWVLRLLGWNALLLFAGVVLIAMAGEAYLRLTMPFMTSSEPLEFVPNVGILRPPNTEVHSTNRLDFWNVSRTNSLGFLDREPPTPERAAATCHISMIGDSFVEAREVPIHDKFQVRLEELAADELPHLNITTSAFGIQHTGQVQQLPFYDEYARLLHPKLLVLVFVQNDFTNNAASMRRNFVKPTVGRRSDGKLELVLPKSGLHGVPWPPIIVGHPRHVKRVDGSYLVFALHKRLNALSRDTDMDQAGGVRPPFERRPLERRHLQYTRFAMEQFKQRADRDGAKLVILASYTLRFHGPTTFERLSRMAATLGIPVIDQADYILRQGAKPEDARWRHNYHWNPAGHRWAAEALLEYIKEHPAICDGPT